ncbi:hypothetical protein L6R53_32560 [Myxococcota bacterium]|nr:hypothetical protein [Myxococcota bacterium]
MGAPPSGSPVAAVVGMGLRCALGDEPAGVLARVDAGETALLPRAHLQPLPAPRAAVVEGPDLRPWLKQRKDAKLLARPSALALPACGAALAAWPGPRLDLGVYLGVGAEPPDDGASEAALAASARDGRLDPALLAGPGRDLYPPLLPLRTLPNMALAHAAIHLDLGGPNGAWAGGPEASLHAVRAALWALHEGRCPAALAGGSDSLVALGPARDLRRLGHSDLPGEAAAVLLLAPVGTPGALCRLALLADPGAAASPPDAVAAHRLALGACGAADGALALLLACARVAAGGPAALVAAGSPPCAIQVLPA